MEFNAMKQLELLKEVVPAATRIAVLTSRTTPSTSYRSKTSRQRHGG